MLKERKIWSEKEKNLGTFEYQSMLVEIPNEENKKQINDEEYFLAEFANEYLKGVLLAFNLNVLDTKKYFGMEVTKNLLNEKEIIERIDEILKKFDLQSSIQKISINENGYIQIVLLNQILTNKLISCAKEILECIRDHDENKNIHITRMFGSYILLANIEGKLKAIAATNIPIEYCPLMYKLLKEVGGPTSENLIAALNTKNKEEQQIAMCELINEVVIKGGYFATNRALNSCEANVLFGASETMASAFQSDLIDAAVIVSNNLGTIITTNAPGTQGAVQRMTGLFYTSPSKQLINTALHENIIPVFPYTAEIDQLEGVKKAISLGYKRIAVSVAASDNYLHKELAKLEKDGITIYKFGLCSTGIDSKTAKIMQEYADVIWSCASKEVKEWIEPNALLQVGVKIPVHIMTKKGSEIVKNHLQIMYQQQNVNFTLTKGEEKNVVLNESGHMRILKKKDLQQCNDCPYPCV